MANEENLTPWQKGQSGNPNGRPRKFVTLMKDQGYKVSEINDTLRALLACTAKELAELYKDENATGLERAVAKSIFTAIKSGDLRNLETILSRTFGQPKQSFEATIQEQPFFPEEDPEKGEES